jgi:phosphoglycolate phosphatase
VGDAERDIAAGRNAGMHTLVALFGYLGETDFPEQWQADGMVESALEILDWLERW